MDDYTREMMDHLKTLVTRTLEKKGVLAKIRMIVRLLCGLSSVRVFLRQSKKRIENNQGLPPALLGSCNDRARQLHASPKGRLLSALICEYLDWAQLNHTLKVYQPECNLPKDSWKSELCDFSSNNGYELNRNGDSAPLFLDVLEGFLKLEVDICISSIGVGATSGNIKGEQSWRYDSEDATEEVMRASAALENLQLDRKNRNLTSSWRNVRDGTSEEEEEEEEEGKD